METNIKAIGDEALASAVFERVKPELMALKEEQLLQVSLDIAAAVATVLGVFPEVRELREQIVKELPGFDIAQFDKLEDYALALSFAQAKFLAATLPPDDLEPLALEASKLRERLLAEARSLTHHGLLSDAQLDNLKGANGKKNVATDVMVLTSLLQANWDRIQGKTPTTVADLEHASRVATRVLRIVGLREQGPAMIAQATDERLRAFTKLMLAYDDARRAVTYLRGTRDDVDTIAPNLHPGRPGPRKKAEEPEVPPGPVATPPAAGSAPAAPVTGAPGASATPAAPAAPAATPAAVRNNGPFMS